jgi:hypothetical protein
LGTTTFYDIALSQNNSFFDRNELEDFVDEVDIDRRKFLAVVFDTVEEDEGVFEILIEEGTVIEALNKPDFATCMSELKEWFLMVD